MTMLRAICISTVFFIFSLVGAEAVHGQPTGTVTGRVTDAETDRPLPGVNVLLRDGRAGTTTGADGAFRMTDVPAGTDTLRVQFVGYQTAKRPVTIEAGQTTRVQLALSPAPVEMRGIEVVAPHPGASASSELEQQRIQEEESADSGTLLRALPGVNATRRGALGLDPNVRGLTESAVGVYVDGMPTAAAGPGRMDTPLSHIDPTAIKRIEVTKGPYALTQGPGNMSAIRVTERGEDPPRTPLTGTVRTGAQSNRRALKTTALAMGRQGRLFYSAGGAWRRGEDYTAGNGREVPGDFVSAEGNGRLGVAISDRSTLSVKGRYQEQNDIDYPGRMLHAEYFETGMGQIEYAFNQDTGTVRSVTVQTGAQQTLHRMTNRTKPSYDNGMRVAVPTEVQNVNGRVAADLALGTAWDVTAGADVVHTFRDATRSRSRVDRDMEFREAAWPGATITQEGGFVEARRTVGAVTLTGTTRLDLVQADARTPSEAFLQSVAPGTDLRQTAVMMNGAVTASLPLPRRWTLSLGAGSVARPPDASERYANRFPESRSQTSAEFLGTPSLNAERSTQADLWLDGQGARWSLSVNGFVRQVDEYITLKETDLDPVLPMSPAVFRYVNGEAAFVGAEVSTSVTPVDPVTIRASGSALWGRDESIGEPAFGVSPPSANLGLRWRPPIDPEVASNVYVDGGVSLVAEQDRVATTRGEEPTDGYATTDLKVGARVLRHLEVQMGVQNVFDADYTNHLNSKNPFSGVQVPEPGRVFTTSLGVRF